MTYCTLFRRLVQNTFMFLSLVACGKDNPPTVEPPPDQPDQEEIYIQWDQQTRRKVSSGPNTRYAGYARIIQLPDQSLLGIYEADGSVVSVKSRDLGNSWSEPVVVAARGEGTNMCVPDLLLLNDQKTLLALYNGRPFAISPDRKFDIRIKKSTDGGQTWADEKVLYEAGYEFENGCWEPAALQLPNGEIQLFFANEGPYTQSNEQNISMIRSQDNGANWTTDPVIVSFRPGRRDGMPVPVLLNNGKDIVVAIEDNAIQTFKPYILRNSLEENWATTIGAESPNRSYALLQPVANEVYAGAPYIRQLSSGETILAYQGTEGRTHDMNFADMKVVIGDDQAKNFTSKSVPFSIPGNKSCLWNSVTVLHDNTIIAVTSTNAYGTGNTEVWMVKGKVINNTNK
ncbi:sialidase family protein [Sphingobacterium corticibacterium]|uniref:Exo-alpha-sialidase n=1 Tax=Sphingobacterium corticibacterium TaxID=2484746 RepID=A0A4Q6XH84_9SPHI|nr:sialidase family protein [Sphingobacterium corticibacterium]RZF58903.1 exo-alpha-sialidase [Sphingobacterium corticibacterium]